MSRRHIPELDGIRGLAILLVFLFHYWGGATFRNPIVHTTGILVQVGWIGVSLFFVLSGFLITGIIWDDHENPGWWKNFYARRALRIFPLYYLCLILLFCSALFIGRGMQALHHIWILVFYLQNLAGTVNYGFIIGPAHFWSLAVEEQFYLVWPLILASCPDRRVARAACVTIWFFSLAARFGVFHAHGALYILSRALERWGELSIGCYLALSFHEADRWQRLYRISCVVFPVALLTGVVAGFHRNAFHLDTPSSYIWGFTLASLLCGGMLVMALNNHTFGAIFRNRALRRLGAISYGFYMVHGFLRQPSEWLAHLTARYIPHVPVAVFTFVWGAALSYPIAVISFHYFELPFLRLRSKFRTGNHTAAV